MKNFRCKISITKLVFLIVMICLCIFTGYQIFTGKEIANQLWETVVTPDKPQGYWVIHADGKYHYHYGNEVY